MINFCKNFLFFLYTFLSTFYENLLYRHKKNKNTKLSLIGYEKFNFKKKLNLKKYFKKKIRMQNNYLNKFIIKKQNIEDLIYYIFIKNNLADKIFNITGFRYSIDFFVAYQTAHIPMSDKHKQIYANHWHRDKPFSKNTLKVIIPIENIQKSHGGIEILDKIKTIANYNTKKKITSFYKMVATTNEYLIFSPNVCLHRAGNPKKNLKRSQIMFQLNPSKNWSFKKNLYELQFYQEPKFPLLTFSNKKFF